ncbi:MAG: hypothetical protein ACM3UZ_13985 [Acidobacteriota bacterium]
MPKKMKKNPVHYDDREMDMIPWKFAHLDFLWPFCRLLAGRKPRN